MVQVGELLLINLYIFTWVNIVSVPGRTELRALHPIVRGEELTVSYLCSTEQLLAGAASRRAALRRGWGFTCSCHLCTTGSNR